MPVFEQGDEPKAEQGSLFVGEAATPTYAQLAVDIGQFFTDFTDQTTYMDTSDDRFNHSHPRTIGFVVEMQQGDTGTLWSNGAAGALEALRITGGDTLGALVAGAGATTFDITSILPAGSDERILIAWASRPNPATTGASDAVQSWFYVYNIDTDELLRHEFTHAIKVSTTDDAIVGATTGGAAAFPQVIEEFWHSTRFQSFAEIRERYIAAATPPTTELEVARQGLPIDTTTGIHLETEFMGPSAFWAVNEHHKSRRRLFSPLVNENFEDPTTQQQITTQEGYVLAPGSSTYVMNKAWARVRPVPEHANLLYVAVQIKSYVTAGGSVPVGIRVYSMNKVPGNFMSMVTLGGDEEEPLQWEFSEEVIDVDHTVSGTGEWVIQALMPIARGVGGFFDNKTVLCVAWDIDPNNASANDNNERLEIRSWHVCPRYKPLTAGDVTLGGDD